MQLNILNLEKKEIGKAKLPAQFDEEVRSDLIQRAVLAIENGKRQSYGAFKEAGQRPSAKLSRRRRNFKGTYGKGISRIPRKTMTRRGSSFFWVGALMPGTVGGRGAHPPKSEKIVIQKINKKENKKAIRSSLSATMNPKIVSARGHIIPKEYPFIITNDFEELRKTKEVSLALEKLGFSEEMERNGKVRIRAGKGKSRGRRYVRNRGILIVVSKECNLRKAAGSLPVEVKIINEINAGDLAPGAVPGRATLFTQKAIEIIEKEKMFE
ncbi:MAG: 50S ribosomal protein L4 [Candidatus Woesearchaeota archaeon]|nr:50S ribosomal protein L4 [Candidatus Woesearchaeota archaeon]